MAAFISFSFGSVFMSRHENMRHFVMLLFRTWLEFGLSQLDKCLHLTKPLFANADFSVMSF